MREKFSKGELVELTGIPSTTLDEWCNKGIVRPLVAAKGSGSRRVFTLRQAVAVAYAMRWRDVGAGLDLLGEIISCVSTTNLELQFGLGNTHMLLVPGNPRLCSMNVPDSDILNVLTTYDQIVRKAWRLDRDKQRENARPRGTIRGRVSRTRPDRERSVMR